MTNRFEKHAGTFRDWHRHQGIYGGLGVPAGLVTRSGWQCASGVEQAGDGGSESGGDERGAWLSVPQKRDT